MRAAMCRVMAGSLAGLVLATAGFAVQPKTPAKGKSQPKKSPVKRGASPKSAGKSAASKPGDQALKEWKALNARRKTLRSQLNKLQGEFTVSSRARKLEIKKEFERLVAEWKTEVEPKMVRLALAKLQADPNSELASRLAEQFPDQQQVVTVTERLIKSGKDVGPVLRLAGIAHFNVNEFQRSAELLEKAREKNARLHDPTLIDLARDYTERWKKEQELRKKEQSAAAKPETRLPQVLIETGKGNVVVELYENEAPNTVANFISLVEKKFYDGQHFFNARPLASIEAGDPKTKPNYDKNLAYGFGGPGYTIPSESAEPNARTHFRGSLSMVSYGKDTEGSQFAILRAPRPEWNPSAGGLGGQTVFGRVVKGMDVVDKLDSGDKIIKMTVLHKRPHAYAPKTSADQGAAPAFPKTDPKAKPKSQTDGKAKTEGKAKPDAKSKADGKSKGDVKSQAKPKAGASKNPAEPKKK